MRWLLFFAPLFAHSLYMGNPGSSDLPETGLISTGDSWIGGKISYLGDVIFHQGLKGVDNSQGKFVDCAYTTNQGVLTLMLIDRLSLYGSMGGMRWEGTQTPSHTVKNHYETSGQLTWGIGGQLVAFQTEKLCFGFDLKYQSSRPRFNLVEKNGTPFHQSARLSWREWQVSTALSYHVDMFYPYIGLRYSNVLARFKRLPQDYLSDNKTQFKARNTDKFGLSIGTTLSSNETFALTLEARMIDQTALSLSFDMRF